MKPTKREKPILFKPELVRAILEGRKTQTRRVIKPQPEGWTPTPCYTDAEVKAAAYTGAAPAGPCRSWAWCVEGDQDYSEVIRCPFGAAGDRLWVRETWADGRRFYPHTAYIYQADFGWWEDALNPQPMHQRGCNGNLPDCFACARADGWRWRPSIHMPREACRLALRIAEVRVERLQDISDDDIRAEGITIELAEQRARLKPGTLTTLRAAWSVGWDTINGKRPGCAWDDNPWLWVIRWRPQDILTGEAARSEVTP